MKVKYALAAMMLCLGLTSGSASVAAQKLYPVQGPLASQSPAPVFKGKGPNALHPKSWAINGEVLTGKCKTVTAASVDMKTAGTPDSYPPQPNLAFAWDLVKGQGYYVSHVLGNKMTQGIFTGGAGTVLQIESIDTQYGVAADNKGNIYKIIW